MANDKPKLVTSPMINGKAVQLVKAVPFYRVYEPINDPLESEGGQTLYFVNTNNDTLEFTLKLTAGMGQGMGYIDGIEWCRE